MREYAGRRGWIIALQVREVGSGATQRQSREQLLEAARRRAIDVVVFWRLDRWGRSVTDLLQEGRNLHQVQGAQVLKPAPSSPSDLAPPSRPDASDKKLGRARPRYTTEIID